MRLTFDDGITRELEFLAGSNPGTVFAPLDDPLYFARVKGLKPTGAPRAPSSHRQIQSCGRQPKFGAPYLAYKISTDSRFDTGS
jgi:hypothetical protein